MWPCFVAPPGFGFVLFVMPTVMIPEVCLLAVAWLPVTSQGAAGDQCISSHFHLHAELNPSGPCAPIRNEATLLAAAALALPDAPETDHGGVHSASQEELLAVHSAPLC